MAAGEDREGGDPEGGYRPIEDYAAVGNCRTAALVSRDGSVDWLCLPRFDSPSTFGALLDRHHGGRFRVGAPGATTVERRYVEDTAVLETTFHTATGRLVLTDCMPVASEERKAERPWPFHQLLRRVEAVGGAVEVEVDFEPRPDYGRCSPVLEDRGPLGIWCQRAGDAMALLSNLPLELTEDRRGAGCAARLEPGDVRWLSFTYQWGEPAVLAPLGDHAESLLTDTLEWWTRWTSRLRYEGDWRDAVARSALTLKLLTYAPSGAVVAAATTSLPEAPGASRNWDYRYCWLRDASWTLQALDDLGYRDEAHAFFEWVLYATRLTAPRLQTVYDVHGRSHLRERALEHLEGYEGSRPVRVGNQAHDQLQLDVYGEVVAAADEDVDRGGEVDRADQSFLAGLGAAVMESWREPDDGIWESRGPRSHHVHSKVMCWAALERLVRMHDRGWLDDVAPGELRAAMEKIREEVDANGVAAGDGDGDRYAGTYDDPRPDAALLRLAIVGYSDPRDPRFRRTFRHVVDGLGCGHGLLRRYPDGFDGLEGSEGAFDLCGFWAVECDALAGELDAAEERFEALLELSNDVGLYAEQTDPETLRFLGNTPQAFTHIGLINAALTLRACRERGSG